MPTMNMIQALNDAHKVTMARDEDVTQLRQHLTEREQRLETLQQEQQTLSSRLTGDDLGIELVDDRFAQHDAQCHGAVVRLNRDRRRAFHPSQNESLRGGGAEICRAADHGVQAD